MHQQRQIHSLSVHQQNNCWLLSAREGIRPVHKLLLRMKICQIAFPQQIIDHHAASQRDSRFFLRVRHRGFCQYLSRQPPEEPLTFFLCLKEKIGMHKAAFITATLTNQGALVRK